VDSKTTNDAFQSNRPHVSGFFISYQAARNQDSQIQTGPDGSARNWSGCTCKLTCQKTGGKIAKLVKTRGNRYKIIRFPVAFSLKKKNGRDVIFVTRSESKEKTRS